MNRARLWAAAALLAAAPAAPAQVEEATARVVPWSGYWWPHFEGRMVSGPLAKYDQLTGSQAAAWEAKAHPKTTDPKARWHGYCHAWSAAAVTEPEPTTHAVVSGPTGQVVLDVGDLKGLLSASHARDVPNVYGRRFNGRKDDDINDLYPDALWRVLKLYVKQQGTPLVLDLDCGPAVWNYPVYAYRVEYAPRAGTPDTYDCRMTILAADDAVPPAFVGTKVHKKTYTFSCRMKGGSVVVGSGQWTGASKDDHPDFAWYPHITKPENPKLEYAKVRTWLGRPLGRDGDTGVKTPPPPPPVLDPENPPQPANATLRPPPPLDGGNGPPPPAAALSPTELLTLITHQKRNPQFSFDITVDKFDGGKYVVGEPFHIQGASNKAGYLYLFHIDNKGNMKLLFPLPGQDNRVPKNSRFVVGGPKDDYKFACTPEVGTQRVKALITTRPLTIPGLDLQAVQQQAPQKDQSAPLQLNPSQQEQMKAIITSVGADKMKPQQVEEFTGVRPAALPFEFSQDEVAFYVGAAGKGPAPAPNKPDQGAAPRPAP